MSNHEQYYMTERTTREGIPGVIKYKMVKNEKGMLVWEEVSFTPDAKSQ